MWCEIGSFVLQHRTFLHAYTCFSGQTAEKIDILVYTGRMETSYSKRLTSSKKSHNNRKLDKRKELTVLR